MMTFLFELAVAFALGGVAGYYVAGVRAFRIARRVRNAENPSCHASRVAFERWSVANRIAYQIRGMLP